MRPLKFYKSKTNKDDIFLQMYLKEFRRVRLLPWETEIKLARRIHNGDKQAFDRMVKANLRFVVAVAKQYQGNGLPLKDLIQEGNLGLIEAVWRFDETRGFKFITYAVWWIRQSILKALSDNSSVVHKPMNQIGAFSKITKAYNRFEQENERLPSAEELAEELDMPIDKVADTMRYMGNDVSVDAPYSKDRNNAVFGVTVDGIKITSELLSDDSHLANSDDNRLLDILIDEDSINPDGGLIFESLRYDMDFVLDTTLGECERDVIKLFFGIGCDELALEFIADKLGITRERARQIKEFALRKLRQNPLKLPLKSYLDEDIFAMTCKDITSGVGVSKTRRKRKTSVSVEKHTRPKKNPYSDEIPESTNTPIIDNHTTEEIVNHTYSSNSSKDELEYGVSIGDANAQYLLGWKYCYALDEKLDFKKALDLFTLAAEQGHGRAMFQIGQMYDFGFGVGNSIRMAKQWYEKAAEINVVDAINRLREIEKKLKQYYGQIEQTGTPRCNTCRPVFD